MNGKYLTLLFHMIGFVNILKKTRALMTSNVMQNLLKLQKIKEKLIFAIWISVIWYLLLEICKLILISCFLDQSGHFCTIHLEMLLFLSYVNQSIFILEILSWFIHIFTQNYVEAEPLEPVLWNFVWINGRSCAFRQSQSEILKMNTLGVIKVLLVSLAFEHRVVSELWIFSNFLYSGKMIFKTKWI